MIHNFKIIKIDDEIYPDSLRNILNPPQQLYVLGNVENLNNDGIAIIGSRCCSEKGEVLANEYAYNLSKLGFTIISGMARGIDTASHIGCLNAGGKTIAVLGSGFNHIFPEENIKLFHRIIENGGTVISEYGISAHPSSKRFVERNRIVSGLSKGVLVIEAKYRSGTSITADFARKQGKEIFCIAHSIDDNTGEGTNRLIKHGAHLVTELSDITEKFDILNNVKLEKEKPKRYVPEEYLEIYKCIENNINTVNEIIKKLGLSITEVSYKLTMMELDSLIYKDSGKFYIKLGERHVF